MALQNQQTGLHKRRKKQFLDAICGLIVGITLSSACWLLFATKSRERLVERWAGPNPAAEALTITIREAPETTRLRQRPAPVPTPAVPRRSQPETPIHRKLEISPTARQPVPAETPRRVTPRDATRRAAPRLDREEVRPSDPAETQKSKSPEVPPQATAPKTSAASGAAAYNLVLSNRPKMRQVASQRAAKWSVLKDDGGVIMIDIVTSGGEEEHYVWSVDLNSKSVTPLSHAARNLEN
jgi:hypothetical protein